MSCAAVDADFGMWPRVVVLLGEIFWADPTSVPLRRREATVVDLLLAECADFDLVLGMATLPTSTTVVEIITDGRVKLAQRHQPFDLQRVHMH